MKNKAVIKIFSKQTTENGTESGEMSVVGTIEHGNGKSIVNYVESNAETGLENTTITITDGSTVSIVREGAFSSEMTVEKNHRHHTFYKTPYGEFTMGIYGNDVTWFRNGAKSVLKMTYTLDFNNGFASENTMKIFIDEK